MRSPISLAAIGGSKHFGRPESSGDREEEVTLRFLLEHVDAGSSCLYLNISYLSEATFNKLLREAPAPAPRQPASGAERFMEALTPAAPYGVEGLYSAVSPGPSMPSPEAEEVTLNRQKRLVPALRERLPAGVALIGGVIGCGGLPDAYVEEAQKCEELGLDLIELNFHCPLQAGMRGAVDSLLAERFPPVSQGGLLAEHPEVVEGIVRTVVKAVDLPVGVKFSGEVGFPRIVDLARRVKRAGAKYIHVGGAAVGIAPPDIYNRGRPMWPFMDGNPFCLTSGSWMRRVSQRDVAAVARFVPGLDIVASGGLVLPEHCIETIMLGATVTQLCAGVLEQGRSLIRRSNRFLEDFLVQQGYKCARDLLGLAQPYIKYLEDIDMTAGQVVSHVDQEICNGCGRCLDNLCVALHSDGGRPMVDEEKCTGCGACALACRVGAVSLSQKG